VAVVQASLTEHLQIKVVTLCFPQSPPMAVVGAESGTAQAKDQAAAVVVVEVLMADLKAIGLVFAVAMAHKDKDFPEVRAVDLIVKAKTHTYQVVVAVQAALE
jgi:hypothetical protein